MKKYLMKYKVNMLLVVIVSLYLVYLVNVQGAHGDNDEHAQPTIIKVVGASHTGQQADDNHQQHIHLVFHKIFFHSRYSS